MNRWVRAGVLTLALFAVNVVGRLVSRLADLTDPRDMDMVAISGMIAVGLISAIAAVWWSIRYPFSRVFFDIGAAILVANLLALLVGPFISGKVPFDDGLGVFVGQFLYFILFTGVGGFLGFFATVALGKDWKSQGLRRYEETHRQRRSKA